LVSNPGGRKYKRLLWFDNWNTVHIVDCELDCIGVEKVWLLVVCKVDLDSKYFAISFINMWSICISSVTREDHTDVTALVIQWIDVTDCEECLQGKLGLIIKDSDGWFNSISFWIICL